METSSSATMSRSLTAPLVKRATFARVTSAAEAFLRAMTDSKKALSSQERSTTWVGLRPVGLLSSALHSPH